MSTFTCYGKTWHTATPAPALLRSKTIRETVEGGGCFAFNVEEGVFTIFSKKKLERLGYRVDHDGSLQPLAPELQFQAYVNGVIIRLPESADAAWDIFSTVTDNIKGQVRVYEVLSDTSPVAFTGDLVTFKRNFYRLYKAAHRFYQQQQGAFTF